MTAVKYGWWKAWTGQMIAILGVRGAVLSPDEICCVDAFSIAVAVHDYIDLCEVRTQI